MRGRVMAMVGAQYGSEGKGMIAEKLATQTRGFGVYVRTGGPNAGHTYYVNQGREIRGGLPEVRAAIGTAIEGLTDRVKVVSRTIPVGACDPNAYLVIGPGAVIDLDLLAEEVAFLHGLGFHVDGRLFVDKRAAVVTHGHRLSEGGVLGQGHEEIGSTGEGVGACRISRIERGVGGRLGAEFVREHKTRLQALGAEVTDTARLLSDWVRGGRDVLLEGTQGAMLSLTHGMWPFVTSHDTNAAQLAADAGLSPRAVTDVMLVVRTYPIRVAGNSGPLPRETTWEQIGQPPETTTVTKKVRRVAEYEGWTVRRAATLNWPTEVALTFVDYWQPSLAGCGSIGVLDAMTRVRIAGVEADAKCQVTMLGTGPDSVIWVNR